MRNTHHILLVEDEPDHAELTMHHLRRADDGAYTVEHSDTLQGALAALAENPSIDCVLLDLGLPDSSSGNTLKSIIEQSPHVPVVVLTALDDIDSGRRAIIQGAQDFLSKSGMTAGSLVKAIDYATERKAIVAKLEKSNEALKHFAQLIAHEVKKPLQALTTTVYHIDERESENIQETSKKLIGLSKRSITDITTIVDELLRYSQVGAETNDSGKFTAVDMRAVAEEAIALIRLEKVDAEVELTCDPLPPVLGSTTQLRHVFQNLVGNAVQYRDHSRKCVVRIGVTESGADDGHHLFFVQDNGRGIPSEYHTRIFDLFFRVQSGDELGSGIGLGFTKQVIEQHGGRIWLESEPLKGSKFYFTLPGASN